MPLKNLIALGAGEITPELGERDNLLKFKTGLKTARNIRTTKFGGARSREGFIDAQTAITQDYIPAYWTIVNKPYLFEVGLDGVTIRFFDNENKSFSSFEDSVFVDLGDDYYTEADLKILHFSSDQDYLYIYCEGKASVKILLDTPYTVTVQTNFDPPTTIPSGTLTVNDYQTDSFGFTTPNGYDVEYAITQVKDGVETFVLQILDTNSTAGGNSKLPNGTGQANNVYWRVNRAIPIALTELPDSLYFYRRPRESGAWGFVGSATPVDIGTGTWQYQIIDFGQDADFANQPPDLVSGFKGEANHFPKTGLIYQNRQIISGTDKKNVAYGSRTDAPSVMTRDFPLQDDSGVTFKTGSDGGAEIGRFFDGRGLLLTTSVGIFETPSDVLTPDTAFAIKRSSILHDEKLPVLGMGSATFVTDKRNEGIFKLIPSPNDNSKLEGSEISIFSSHLFEGDKPVSWTTQDDGAKYLWIALTSGRLISFTYQEDQDLQSFTRHDLQYGKFLQVMTLRQQNVSDILVALCEITKADGTTARLLQTLSDKNLDVQNYIGTDYTKIFKNQMIAENETITITNDGDEEDGFVSGEMESSVPIFTDTAGLGAVGSRFRFFNPTTYENVDVIVTAYTSTTVVEVELAPDSRDFYQVLGVEGNEFDLTEMYQTFTTLDGLGGNLDGRKVAIRLDGFTEASPLNNLRNYTEYTVVSNSITLDKPGAIISVGLPIVKDMQTLDPESIEFDSDKTKSQICNKMYVSYYKSRGLYLGSSFPTDDTLTGLIDHETFFAPDEGIEAMQPPLPYSRRVEASIVGDWSAAASVALRSVDPQPIGVRGLLLDYDNLTGA